MEFYEFRDIGRNLLRISIYCYSNAHLKTLTRHVSMNIMLFNAIHTSSTSIHLPLVNKISRAESGFYWNIFVNFWL